MKKIINSTKPRHIVIIFMLFAVTIYTTLRANKLISGPEIQIDSHTPYSSDDQTITIDGFVKNVKYFTINDERVYPQSSGMFTYDITLPIGYNIIELYARDRHTHKKVIHLPLIIKEKYGNSKKENSEESIKNN